MTPSLRRAPTKQPQPAQPSQPSGWSLALAGGKLLCLILVAAGMIYFFTRGGDLAPTRPKRSELVDTRAVTKARVDFCGLPGDGPRPVAFEMVYSDEMRPWIEMASDEFLQRCPNLQVKLRAVPDIEAADAIVSGELKPVLWAPTDDLALQYLTYRWKQRGGKLPFKVGASVSLVESPLVLMIWQDRLRLLSALLRAEGDAEGIWLRGLCALVPREPDLAGVPIEAMIPGTWRDWYAPYVAPPLLRERLPTDVPLPVFDDVKTWGRVKIGHAKPTRDSAGSAALYLMAYDYLLPPNERQTPDPRAFEKSSGDNRYKLGKWLRRCEAGLDEPPATTAGLTKDIFDAGPMLYDGVVTWEHLALPFLDRIDSHADAMRKLVILYPEPTLVARHPAVYFDATPEQTAAARRWLRFLLSKEMQERAIEAGFRPVGRDVTIAGYNVEKNRFLQLRRYGVLLHPSLQEAPAPDGSQIRELLSLWGEVTGRN